MAFTSYSYAPGLAILGQTVKDINDRAAKQQDLDNEKAAATEISGILANQQQPTQTLGQLGPAGGAASASSTPSFAGGQTAMRMPADPEIENRFISTLKAGGLTNPNGLAAMAAYANAESGYSPSNITGSWSDPSQSGQPGTSGGILSWRGPRLAAMQRMTAGADDPVVAQAKFALTENPDLTLALQNAKSPAEANALMANAWKFAGYDQPGGETARRLAMTQAYVGRVGDSSAVPATQTAQVAPDSGSQPMQVIGQLTPSASAGAPPLPPPRPQIASAGAPAQPQNVGGGAASTMSDAVNGGSTATSTSSRLPGASAAAPGGATAGVQPDVAALFSRAPMRDLQPTGGSGSPVAAPAQPASQSGPVRVASADPSFAPQTPAAPTPQLDPGSMYRLTNGAKVNPNSPAIAYASPNDVLANPSFFFNPDRSRKSASEVVAAIQAGQGGGAPTAGSAASPSGSAAPAGGPGLGQGAIDRVMQGAKANPDTPAVAYASATDVYANRDLFFNPDGSRKTAAEVAGSLAPAQQASAQGASSAAPVQTASIAPAAPASTATQPAAGDVPVKVPGYDGTWTRASVAAAAAKDPGRDGVPEDSELAAAQKTAGDAPAAPVPATGVQTAQAAPSLPAPAQNATTVPALNPRAMVGISPGMQSGIAQTQQMLHSDNPAVRRFGMGMAQKYLTGQEYGFQVLGDTLYRTSKNGSLEPVATVPGKPVAQTVGDKLYWLRPGEKPTADNLIGDAKGAGETSTANMKDYASYSAQELAAGRTPLSMFDYEVAIKRAGAPSAESEMEKKAGGALGDEIGEYIKAGRPAQKTIQQLDLMKSALDQGGDNMWTGPFAKQVLAGKQLLSSITGQDVEGLPETETLNKLQFGLATNAAKAISSRVTQMEFGKALENTPGLFLSKQGNYALIDINRQQAQVDAGLAKLASDKKNWSNWSQVSEDYVNAHPIMSPFDKSKPFGAGDIQRLQTEVAKGGGGSPAPLSAADTAQSLANAKAAIAAKPAARDAIIQRLKASGIDTSGL